MPPPPPPSPSYRLVIDDSSSSEEDKDEQQQHEDEHVSTTNRGLAFSSSAEGGDPMSPLLLRQQQQRDSSSSSSSSDQIPRPGSPDTSESEQLATATVTPTKTTTTQSTTDKKRASSNHNRNSKSHSTKSPPNRVLQKKVSFGSVVTHEFGRCLGEHVVPLQGAWPLGLEWKPATAAKSGSRSNDGSSGTHTPIDEYENEKQQRLQSRYKELFQPPRQQSPPPPPPPPLETRQYDYKADSKNPLFGALHEKERMRLLLDYSNNNSNNDSTPPPPPPDRTKRHQTRSRSFSERTTVSSSSSSKQQHHHHTRSRSFSDATSAEQYNDTFTQVAVHQLRRELQVIQHSRTKEGSMGCTCRKRRAPKGTSNNRRRMNKPTLLKELRKRHLLPADYATQSPDSLELLLHTAVQQEACCSSQDCPCVVNQLQCQADTCSCWWSSHQGNGSNNNTLSTLEIQKRCGNPFGMYAVNEQEIADFRKSFLLCQVIHNNTAVATTTTDGSGPYKKE